jgi:hypothetical protein
LKDVLRLFNGFTHTDDPFVFVESVFELPVLPLKAEISPVHSPCEVVDELAPKDQGEGFLVKQVVILAWDPAFAL